MDHKLKSLELLDEIDALRANLSHAYSIGAASSTVAAIHQAINVSLKLADVHSNIYVGDALTDSLRFGVLAQ